MGGSRRAGESLVVHGICVMSMVDENGEMRYEIRAARTSSDGTAQCWYGGEGETCLVDT